MCWHDVTHYDSIFTDASGVMSDIVFNKVLQVHQPKGGAQDVKLGEYF